MLQIESRAPDAGVLSPDRQTADLFIKGLSPRQLGLVMQAIHERIAEPISVSMLASIAGLSRSHFSSAFRTSVGRSPHAHIVGLRLKCAMTLMLDTDMPLSQIAVVAGFSDQAHFTNHFRRNLGVTPKQWRKARQ